VIGDKERDEQKLAIRGYRAGDLGAMSVEDFMSRLKDEIENKK
jgi:threonyl-tRNA synthetase